MLNITKQLSITFIFEAFYEVYCTSKRRWKCVFEGFFICLFGFPFARESQNTTRNLLSEDV